MINVYGDGYVNYPYLIITRCMHVSKHNIWPHKCVQLLYISQSKIKQEKYGRVLYSQGKEVFEWSKRDYAGLVLFCLTRVLVTWVYESLLSCIFVVCAFLHISTYVCVYTYIYSIHMYNNLIKMKKNILLCFLIPYNSRFFSSST
jgi:hypothetical protein